MFLSYFYSLCLVSYIGLLLDFKYTDNHKMLLCKALLDIGAWEQAYKLIKKHPRYSCMNCPFVAISLVRFANYMIEPLYDK